MTYEDRHYLKKPASPAPASAQEGQGGLTDSEIAAEYARQLERFYGEGKPHEPIPNVIAATVRAILARQMGDKSPDSTLGSAPQAEHVGYLTISCTGNYIMTRAHTATDRALKEGNYQLYLAAPQEQAIDMPSMWNEAMQDPAFRADIEANSKEVAAIASRAAVPEGRAYAEQRKLAVTGQWIAGWDACRREFAAPVAQEGKALWSYNIAPPQGFIDYVRKNYSGEVVFHDPEWHALRLWNAAMRNAKPPFVQEGKAVDGEKGGAA